jgi:hypothetical protein
LTPFSNQTKKKLPLPDNGVRLVSPVITGVKGSAPAGFAAAVLIASLCVFGSLYTFSSFFHPPFNGAAVALFGAVCCLVYTAIFYFPRAVLPGLIAAGAATALWGFFARRLVVQGFLVTLNSAVDVINRHLNWSLYPYVVEVGPDKAGYAATVFFILVLSVFSAIIAGLVVHRKFLLVLALTLPCVVAGCYYTLVPNYGAVLMLLCGWAALYAVRYTVPTGGRRARYFGKRAEGVVQAVRRRRRRGRYYSNRTTLKTVACQSGALTLAAVILSFCLFALAVPSSTYRRSERADQLGDQITGYFERFSTSGVHQPYTPAGISGGRLGDVGKLEFQYKTNLLVHMSQPTPLYLRGFVGSVYTGRSWELLPDSAYTDHAAYAELAARGFEPLNQTAQYCSLLCDYINSDYTLIPQYLQIENVGASREYYYTPYSLRDAPGSPNLGGSQFLWDATVQTGRWNPANSYSLKCYDDGDRLANIRKGLFHFAENNLDFFGRDSRTQYTVYPMVREFIRNESNYRTFVKQAYTQLSMEAQESAKNILVEALSANPDIPMEYLDPQNWEDVPLQYKTEVMVPAVLSGIRYSLSPGATPREEDFVTYFLTQQRKGYCTHFASAATVMLRALGVPARYVEGYVVTKHDVSNAQPDGWINLMDTNTHAWTEIYLDGYGWMPLEFTPGFTGLYEINFPEEEESAPPPSKAPSTPPSRAPSESQPNGPVSSHSSSMPADVSFNSVLIPLIFLILILGLILAAAAFFVLRRARVLRLRRRAFEQPDASQAALEVYRYILALYTFAGVPVGNCTPLEYAAMICEKRGDAEGRRFTTLTWTVLRAKYSEAGVSQQELLNLRAFAKEQLDQIYEECSKGRRFACKYLHNLC